MPTGIHELFLDGVEDAIRSQLKAIRSGSGTEACFALKVRPARSTEICFPVENAPSNTKSKYEPDASFEYDDARYPGVIIEVAYSQKKKRLDRLAEGHLVDSDASVRVIVGLDIEYESLKLLPGKIPESLQYRRPLEYDKSFSPTSTPCSFSHLAISRCPNCAATPRGLMPSLFSSRLSACCSLRHITIT